MLESQLEELGVLGSFLPPAHYGVAPEWMRGEVAMARFEAL